MKKNTNIRILSIVSIVVLSLLASACQPKKEHANLTRIIERGFVQVGTLFGPNTYYIDAQGPAGVEYELAKLYADSLGVELKVVPSYHLDELFTKVDSGELDFLAAGLTVTEQRLTKYRFSPSYNEVSQKLVFKQGKKWPRDLTQLDGVLIVPESSSYQENLEELKKTNSELTWQTSDEFDSEELLISILDDEIDYTIIDSSILAIHRRYYPEISIAFTIKKADPIAWLVSKHNDDSILASLIEFFGKIHHDGTILSLNDKYYGHIEKFNYVDTRLFIKAVEKKLPKYQHYFELYGEGMDWRLLAAISYQESHWQPHARSYTGVRGMMMLTLVTAKQMGIKSRLDAEQSIKGGAKYFNRMIDRMPDRIQNPDRTWFALAAYNVGLGHLNDARKITRQQGADPDRWVDVKTRLPLLKQKKFYKNTKYGYARGDEPVHYVENIRRYYDTLTWLDEKAQKEALLAKEALNDQKALSTELIPVTLDETVETIENPIEPSEN